MNKYLASIQELIKLNQWHEQNERELAEKQRREFANLRQANKESAKIGLDLLCKIHGEFAGESYRIFVVNENRYGFNLDVKVIVANGDLLRQLGNVAPNKEDSPELYGNLLEQCQYGVDYVFAPDSVKLSQHLLEFGGIGLVEAFYKEM